MAGPGGAKKGVKRVGGSSCWTGRSEKGGETRRRVQLLDREAQLQDREARTGPSVGPDGAQPGVLV